MTCRFSIVIPTRDRPALVPGALASALAQTFDDFEVVVCDNSLRPETGRWLATQDHPRLRVVRTPGDLLMHDSWRCAASHARGAFVTFLCDDDAIHPRLLEILDRVLTKTSADAAGWGRAGCMFSRRKRDDGVGDLDARIEFRTVYSDAVYDIDRPALIDAAYAMAITHNDFIPRMLNAVAARPLLVEAEREGRSFFRPSCPDYSAMLSMAVRATRLVFLDAPLCVTGLAPESTGWTSAHRAEVDPTFTGGVLTRTDDLVPPLVTKPVVGWIGQTYMQCARDEPALAGRAIDVATLLGLAGQEIDAWRRQGFDVSAAEREWASAVESEPAAAEAARAFRAARTSVETDRFLVPVPDADFVLGQGPFLAHGPTIDLAPRDAGPRFAAGMDAWLATHATAADDLWEHVAQRAGPRTIVLYGLGNGGRALARLAPPGVAGTDDGRRDWPFACERVDSARLDPASHFVLVTPLAWTRIAQRLKASGFDRGRDWGVAGDLAVTCRGGNDVLKVAGSCRRLS